MRVFTQRFWLVLVLGLFLAFASDALGQRGLQRAMQVQAQNNPVMFQIPGVEATGISADANGNAVIVVYTRHANVPGVPAALNGVRVRKSVSGPIVAWDDKHRAQRGKPNQGGSDPRSRFDRAVPIGVSVGTFKLTGINYCFAGTLGCRLKAAYPDGSIGRFILSNNHVLADENGGNRGSDLVIQPGTLDNNCTYDPADVIGTLHDFVDIDFGPGRSNRMDAAIATTDASLTGTATPAGAYGTPSATVAFATPGMVVQKHGRTTGLTEGVVDAINVQANVGYETGTATFVDQIVIVGRQQKGRRYVSAPFSDSGDSGSLIVTLEGNQPTALLFAGNSQVTLANPIDVVLAEFSVRENAVITVDDGN